MNRLIDRFGNIIYISAYLQYHAIVDYRIMTYRTTVSILLTGGISRTIRERNTVSLYPLIPRRDLSRNFTRAFNRRKLNLKTRKQSLSSFRWLDRTGDSFRSVEREDRRAKCSYYNLSHCRCLSHGIWYWIDPRSRNAARNFSLIAAIAEAKDRNRD